MSYGDSCAFYGTENNHTLWSWLHSEVTSLYTDSTLGRYLYWMSVTFLIRAGKELARYNTTDRYPSFFAMSKQFRHGHPHHKYIPSPGRGASSFTKSTFPIKVTMWSGFIENCMYINTALVAQES